MGARLAPRETQALLPGTCTVEEVDPQPDRVAYMSTSGTEAQGRPGRKALGDGGACYRSVPPSTVPCRRQTSRATCSMAENYTVHACVGETVAHSKVVKARTALRAGFSHHPTPPCLLHLIRRAVSSSRGSIKHLIEGLWVGPGLQESNGALVPGTKTAGMASWQGL